MTTNQIYVVPREGLMVPDPAARGSSPQVRLPPEGKLVEDAPYWRKRHRDGDIEIREPAPAPTAEGVERPGVETRETPVTPEPFFTSADEDESKEGDR
jgi:hypothetical protein